MSDHGPSPYVVPGPDPQTEISDPAFLVKIPLVSVLIITYNHAPFIADAIEGVIRQKTGFPIELIIGEDCSTDETRRIVLEYQRRYPQVIRVIYSGNNVGMQRNYRRVYEAARGGFIAFCEGDDVWIDERKLDKQVQVMKAEPDCSMVFHAARIYRMSEETVEIRRYGSNVKSYSLHDVVLAGGGFILSGSTMVRRACIDPIPTWFYECEIGDYPFAVHCASRGKVIYLPDVMSMYRMGVPGSWVLRNAGVERQQRTLDSILWMLDEFRKNIGEDDAGVVDKAKGKFIISFMMGNDRSALPRQDRLRYLGCVAWKGRMLMFLTRFHISRRIVKMMIRSRERIWRRLSGRSMSMEADRFHSELID